jgi:periplasmic protein TonB
VAIEIDKNGNVLVPTVVSGPAMLRQMVLDTVRQYKYKPYLLNGKAANVETTVTVAMGLQGDCSAT